MTLRISFELMERIRRLGEERYPEETAGVLLGRADMDARWASTILPFENTFREEARQRRYQISPQDMLMAEDEADRLELDVVGIFHSHPDHPASASDFDRQWALPWFSYLITSVVDGKAGQSRAWRLTDDRSTMVEESLAIADPASEAP